MLMAAFGTPLSALGHRRCPATLLWIGSRFHGGPAMVRIDVETLISRPVEEVWDYFMDFKNSSRWTRSGSELRQTSAGPLRVGATVESVRSVFGREITSQAMVATQCEPGLLISFTTAVAVLGNAVGGF